MENKQRKKLVYVITYAVVLIEALIIVGLFVSGMVGSDLSIQETDTVWVDLNVSGSIQVEVLDTNCGEVPDEAWEEARRLLSKCSELKDIKFKTVRHILVESENKISESTNTDAKVYMVTVAGKVRGDNVEEAKEHFWEGICSGVGGEWCISEIDL